MIRLAAVVSLVALALPVFAQDPASGYARVSDSVLTSLSALGASNGVPDGAGVEWTAKQRVRGQNASLAIFTTQAGLSLPVWEDGNDQFFALASGRWMNIPTTAMLRDDHVRMPNNWYDLQAGGLFIRQLGDGWSWGVSLTGGSIGDRPFNSGNELAANALAFVRRPAGGEDAWLFYVVSATNGQIGQNIPIPGVAYEFKTTDWKGTVGFPFVNLNYRPAGDWGWELNYAALTDVLTRVSYYPTETTRLYGGFAWTNQAWFRSNRAARNDQFFYYEKRLESGLVITPRENMTLEFAGGWAFDRYFFETQNFSLSGRNRVDVGSGPFVRFQLEIKY